MHTGNDEQVMMQIRAGNVALLAVLFERHHVRLFNFFLRLTGERAVSEDLVQEMFLRLLKYRNTYREQHGFTSWMFRIARNVHKDFLRKKAPCVSGEEIAEREACAVPCPASQAEKVQEKTLLKAALARLSPRKREVLLLSRFQEMKYEEIAAVFDCSVGAVKVMAHRAINDLRQAYLDAQGGTS